MTPPEIVTVQKVITDNRLQIPEYQRPYKWTLKNVNQLIDDIITHREKTSYRLGTLVLHEEQKDGKTIFNIVDGQQRTISLSLIAYALYENFKNEIQNDPNLKTIDFTQLAVLHIKFKNSITKYNIQNNYAEIKRRVQQFDVPLIKFFLQQCTLVRIQLNDISEAFQFFDAQNARGKDLEPHDLLKAFHLRAMRGNTTPEEELNAVATWEAMATRELADLFENYLFKIRNWSKGFSARYFTKEEVDVFKGINVATDQKFPYSQLYNIAHFYTEQYNQEYHRKIDGNIFPFPFQLDQTILNGKRFFEMISHYKNKIAVYQSNKEHCPNLNKIRNILNTYEGRYRIGDGYVRTLFNCAVLYYVDKFGREELDLVIDKIFVWAYSLRLSHKAVQIASMDNHALNDNLFKVIREALNPKSIMNYHVPFMEKNESTKTDTVYNHCKQLGYAR